MGNLQLIVDWLDSQGTEESHLARDKLLSLSNDAKRLDYIENNARCDVKMDGNHVWWPTSFNHRLTGPSLREAIDAAMK